MNGTEQVMITAFLCTVTALFAGVAGYIIRAVTEVRK